MISWGSIPDWVSVVISLLALIGFVIVEREKLIFKIHRSKSENSSNNAENEQKWLNENNIDIRAELYSRILIGIMFGVALSPILVWASFSFFPHQYDYKDYANIYALENTAES